MTFVVPFDGSELAEAALVRALEYGQALEEPVTAVTVVPERKRYARQKGWIGEEDTYDPEVVIETLRTRVHELAPVASFDAERIREFPPEDEIATHVERLAIAHDPSVVFLGSDNAGRIVQPLASVGAHVAAEDAYDVFIVRQLSPPGIDGIEPRSEFYGDESS